ncbi:unnamed protein product [Schistosoma curassoni]|uniref:Reverse transcriptase domain-containing protein n=1 Tax=Schistosoma curassoni TaxID=6186 RepID=A0A183KYS6_9TREM|nr:unnamed protein product [Schistosoma curassoni]
MRLGPDIMPAESVRSDIEATANILHLLVRKIWEEEQVPTDWKVGYLIKTSKKDMRKCENCRGITLLPVSREFLTVSLDGIKDSVDAQFRDRRTGFLKDRSRTDQIAKARIIVEESVE